MLSNSVCNHTHDKQAGLRLHGCPICYHSCNDDQIGFHSVQLPLQIIQDQCYYLYCHLKRGFHSGLGTKQIEWLWRWFSPPSLTFQRKFFLIKNFSSNNIAHSFLLLKMLKWNSSFKTCPASKHVHPWWTLTVDTKFQNASGIATHDKSFKIWPLGEGIPFW